MLHVDRTELQSYLAGALDGERLAAIEAHLIDCDHCTATLAAIAAEDAALTDALTLDAAEIAWIESVDLAPQVVERLPTPFRISPPMVVTLLLALAAAYLGSAVWSAGTGLLGAYKGIGGAIHLLFNLGPLLVKGLVWLSQGGLLSTLWPVILLGALIGLGRTILVKENRHYA